MNIVEKLKEKLHLILFFIILITGLVIRIREALLAELWYDEVFTSEVVRLDWAKMFEVIAADKVHPPTYYVFVKIISEIVGYSDFSLRILGIASGIALVAFSYYFAIKIFRFTNKYTALIFPTLFSLSIFFITYSVEGRSYSLIALIYLVFFYFACKEIKLHELRNIIAMILLGIFLFLVHFASIFFILCTAISLLAIKIYPKFKNFNTSKIYLIGSLIAVVIFIGFILFEKNFIEITNFYNLQFGYPWLFKLTPNTLLSSLYSVVLGVNRPSEGVPLPIDISAIFDYYTIGFAILLIIQYAIITGWKKSNSIKLITLSMIIPYFIFYIGSAFHFNLFIERYFIPVAVLVLLLIGYAIVQTKNINKYFPVIGISFFVILSFINISKQKITLSLYRDLVEDISLIDTNEVLFDDGIDFISTRYYNNTDKNFKLLKSSDYNGYKGWALVYPADLDDTNTDNKYIVTRSPEKYKDNFSVIEQSEKFFILEANSKLSEDAIIY